MDLHFTDDQPTFEEREAIDASLSSQSPQGDLRQYLLPVLHAIQGRVGWISLGALNYACRALDVPPADAFGVADFYAMFQTRPHPPVAIHVCDDIGCQFRGAEALCAQVAESGVAWHRSPCLGYCERAPAALVTVAGKPPREISLAPASVESIQAAVAGPLTPVPSPIPSLPPGEGRPLPQGSASVPPLPAGGRGWERG